MGSGLGEQVSAQGELVLDASLGLPGLSPAPSHSASLSETLGETSPGRPERGSR